ncbi:hypothetical protein SKAU_G00231050 [Synaphobranchus kaupii]|uniref:Uncharacterized protein n=1 Tax=Synaphobranchus kaupii TaxID=118154 RepID=A0A9Q1F625_SYNKA|nr:hypothetical protein SKAU_G00231050 [Synaphobranchus kaupii]
MAVKNWNQIPLEETSGGEEWRKGVQRRAVRWRAVCACAAVLSCACAAAPPFLRGSADVRLCGSIALRMCRSASILVLQRTGWRGISALLC